MIKIFLVFVVLGSGGTPLQTKYPMPNWAECQAAELAAERMTYTIQPQKRMATIVECVATVEPSK